MNSVFKFIIDSRKAFIQLIDGLTIDQLNHIPSGFNNNIIWNFGHIVVSTQTLCYVRTGIWKNADTIKYVSAYAKGTKPTYVVSLEEVEELKALAISSISQIEKDYEAGLFQTIAPYDTATYGSVLQSFEDVIVATAGHDNVHFGYAIAQKRIINNQ